MGDPVIHRPYCLRCYAAMESYAGSRQTCARCGYVNLKLDQGLYWTKEKRFRDLEELAKTLIVFLLVGLALLLGFGLTDHIGIGMGQGWVIGFPILIVVVLWETASKITGHKPYFRATIVWRILALVAGLLWVPLAVATSAPLWKAAFLGFAVLSLGLAVALGRIGRALARWRDRRVLAGQTAEG